MSQPLAIILGSSRSDGNTKKICDFISQISGATIFDLNDFNIGYYTYDHKNSDDDFTTLMEKIITYDTLVFATPVYWYSMSAQMKTFLDRYTDLLKIHKNIGRQLRGKKMIVVCCSSGEEEYPEFWKPFERSAAYLGMKYLGNTHTWVEVDEIPLEVKNKLKELFT